MSLSIVTAPKSLNFSRNQIPLVIESSDYYSTSPGVENYDMLIDTYPSAADTLEVEFVANGISYDLTFTFVASTSPNIGNLELSSRNQAGTDQEWQQNFLAPQLALHPVINEVFQLSFLSGPQRITWTSYLPGVRNLVVTPVGWTTAGNPPNPVGVDAVVRPNYQVLMRLVVETKSASNMAERTRSDEYAYTPASNKRISLDLQPIINRFFQDPDLPVGSSFLNLADVHSRRFWIELGRQFGNPPARQALVRFGPYRVLRGGVAVRDFTKIRTSISAWYDRPDRFMTLNKVRHVTLNQPDWLSFFWNYTPSGGEDVFMLYQVNYTDGTSASGSLGQVTGAVTNNYVYYVRTGWLNNPTLQALPKTPLNYRIWLSGENAGDISERIIYNVEQAHTNTLYLMYENSQGAMETMHLRWDYQRQFGMQQKDYEKQLPVNYAITDRSVDSYAHQMVDSIAITTNQVPKHQAVHLNELYVSRNVFLICGSDWLPVTIDPAQVALERQNIGGAFFPGNAFNIRLEREMAFSRIVKITNAC